MLRWIQKRLPSFRYLSLAQTFGVLFEPARAALRRRVTHLRYLAFALTYGVFLAPAHAADSGGIFKPIGDLLFSWGNSVVTDLGKGAMLLGVAGTIILYILRVGYVNVAISIALAGAVLSKAPQIVEAMF